MYYTATAMTLEFESEKKRKALIWTAAIITVLLLLAILLTWQNPEIPKPKMADLIEINLGNDEEGFGTEQPLIKGEMNQNADQPDIPKPQQSVKQDADPADDATNPDETDNEAATVKKPLVSTPKAPIDKEASKPVNNPKPVTQPAVTMPKPQTPKIPGYPGPGHGSGNGADVNNDHYSQGNNPNGTGDRGNPNGTPNGTGNNPRPTVAPKIVKYYSFSDDLPKATIYAIIKVGAGGNGGTFIGFDKKSTSTDPAYGRAINDHLKSVEFDKYYEGQKVTVQFNFKLN